MTDLDAADKLANAVTQPGPWVSVVQDGNATVVDAHGMWVADCGAAPDDAAFIAASRTLVVDLIAEVRQLRADLVNTARGHAPFNGAETTKMLEAIEQETAEAIADWIDRTRNLNGRMTASIRAGEWKP